MTENGEWNNTLDSAHLMHIDCFIYERIVKIDLKAFDKHKEKRYSSLEDIKGGDGMYTMIVVDDEMEIRRVSAPISRGRKSDLKSGRILKARRKRKNTSRNIRRTCW